MSETALDLETVIRRLDALDREIRQLRKLLQPQESPAQATQPSNHPYVERVSTVLSGEPVIKGTRTPVRAIAEHWKFGDTPEEIGRKLPHLRLAQIFDALGYYDDHRDEIEHHIALNRVPVNE